jgi:hypothetical protein
MMADACEAALRSMTLSDGFGPDVVERAKSCCPQNCPGLVGKMASWLIVG